MKGAWSLRGFALAHLHRHVHMNTHSALTHVGPIDLLEQTLLQTIMLFTSHGKSISLLSLLASTWRGTLLISNVMLPVWVWDRKSLFPLCCNAFVSCHFEANLKKKKEKLQKTSFFLKMNPERIRLLKLIKHLHKMWVQCQSHFCECLLAAWVKCAKLRIKCTRPKQSKIITKGGLPLHPLIAPFCLP